MRVLCTGSTGFLGSHLVPSLIAHGHEVVKVAHLGRLDHAIADVGSVVHLAAQTEVSRAVADPTETLEGNVLGTWRVLEACRKYSIPRVVVASTDKVYGEKLGAYHEDDALL